MNDRKETLLIAVLVVLTVTLVVCVVALSVNVIRAGFG